MNKTFEALNSEVSSDTEKLNPLERAIDWSGRMILKGAVATGDGLGSLWEQVPSSFGQGQMAGAEANEDREYVLCTRLYEKFISRGATPEIADAKVAAYVLKYLR